MAKQKSRRATRALNAKEDRLVSAQIDYLLHISSVTAETRADGSLVKFESFSFSAAPRQPIGPAFASAGLAARKRPAALHDQATLPLSVASAGSVEPTDLFRAAVEMNWSVIYRYLYCLTGNPHDTEDLTQETFLRALRRWNTFQQGTNLRAWLLRIGTNAFFDTQRKKRTLTIGPLCEEIEGRAKSAEAALEDREQGALILAALHDLLEVTRIVFHLRVTKDLPFKEIAKLAGITEVAARQHMHLARTKLLKRFGGSLAPKSK